MEPTPLATAPATPLPSLAVITDLMRDISRISDPQKLVQAYKARAGLMRAVDRTVSLSRRDVPAEPSHLFRITRSDIWEREVDPWKEREKLPLLRGGILGGLLYAGEACVVDELHVAPDDPAAEHLAGMGSLAAIPHFDDGVALNMVVHMCREKGAFDHERMPDLVVMSGLFGRTMHQLVLANHLRQSQERLQEQYGAVTELSDTILEQARALKGHAATLEERVRQRTAELEESHVDAIYMLAAASEAKDDVTGDHVRRLQLATERLARAMGVGQREAEAMGRAAILHDVGKMHVPDEILKKAGPLTAEERRVMERHTVDGERILPERKYFAMARRVARSHHENWDGSGYPDGLRGEQIPLEARLVHVADVFDALTHARPYKLAWEAEEAMRHIEAETGKMFDPVVVAGFRAMRRGEGRAAVGAG